MTAMAAFVRASMDDLDIIEQAIHVLNAIPPQLSISAKFAEFTQNDSRGSASTGSLAMFLPWMTKRLSGGTSLPSWSPSVENSLGVFLLVVIYGSASGSDQKLTNGVRTDGPDRFTIPAMATFTGILTNLVRWF